MGVYTLTSSALQGPSVPINEGVKLHRLFERNENAYPEHLAIIHGGTYHKNVGHSLNFVQNTYFKTQINILANPNFLF